ncbi:MAG: DoxX family protein [Chlamydiales bacterium]|nr:DoxX family protein [Chlamydiales bacterium]
MQFLKPRRLPCSMSTGLLLLRVVVGLAFMFHGYGKVQNLMGWMGPESPVPAVFQVAAGLSEFLGGFLLILGLLTPIASFFIACTMATAVFMHVTVFKDPFVSTGAGSYELASVYFCVALLVFLAGPGCLSLDRFIFGEKD